MNKLFFVTVFIILFTTDALYSQELFVRNDKYSTDLFIKVDPKIIGGVDSSSNSVTIYFNKKLKNNFTKDIRNSFVSSVVASDNKITVGIKPDNDFNIINDLEGIKVVVSKKKTNSDILSSYGVSKPFLAKDNVRDEAVSEETLNRADRLITDKRFSEASTVLNNLLKDTKNDFYRQEAMYKLGQVYLLMAESSPDYFMNAYQTFDDFATLYPNNFRIGDALFKSAHAKMQINQPYEAISTYRKIIESVHDIELKRLAQASIGDVYLSLSQYTKAIDELSKYVSQYSTDAEKMYAKIASIYNDLREYDLAFENYLKLDFNKYINDPTTDVKNLLNMANTYRLKKRYDDALKIYRIIFEKYPDSTYANEAISASSKILEETGREEDSDKLLLHLKATFPNSMSGQSAGIEYAKKYAKSKPYSFWNSFFEDIMSKPDEFSLLADAEYIMISALYREKNIDETYKRATEFLTKYSYSQHIPNVNTIREEILFSKLVKLHSDKDYPALESEIKRFKSEFPESKFMPRVDGFQLDIKFREALKFYAENNFGSAQDMIEKHIIDSKPSEELDRWFDLLQDIYYKQISVAVAVNNQPMTATMAKNFITIFPKSKYQDRVVSILNDTITKMITTAYDAKEHPKVTAFYDFNKGFIAKYFDKIDRDNLEAMVGLSAYEAVSEAVAKEFYNRISPNSTSNYITLGLLLKDSRLIDQVDIIDNATLNEVIDTLERKDVDLALQILDNYKSSPKDALRLKYQIAKNMSNEVRRDELISDIYDILRSDINVAFDGSDSVALDVGLQFYKKNNYRDAIIPLKEFIDISKDNGEKRAEALYYLGKSFISMNDMDRGYQYYNELINTIPTSIFAGIAKSELDESNWKSKINNF